MIRVRGFGSGRSYDQALHPVGPRGGFGNYEWTARMLPSSAPPLAADLLRVGCAVHLADRLVRRSASMRRHLRRIEVQVEVAEPAKWKRTAQRLEELAEFATGGDTWHFLFTPTRTRSHESRDHRELPRRDATSVALFSGGLDSLCGAADLAQKPNAHPVFVTHSPPGRRATQRLLERVFLAFDRELPASACIGYRLELREAERSGTRSLFQEASRRSRPFFFLALACATAIAHDVPRIQMSENGALALSLPHRYDAFGPSMARQAHTFLLTGFEALLKDLLPNVPWTVTNPFVDCTKGEACLRLGPASLLARDSASCEYLGHQRARLLSWKSRHPIRAPALGEGPHCGLCIPCIVRRAALKRARVADPDRAYFASAPEVLARIQRRQTTRALFGRRNSPPLLDMLVPNALYLERHCRWLESSPLVDYAIQFLPELRGNRPLSVAPTMDLRATHALSRRYAREILTFLHE